ncbi:MAG: transporter [Proteobacteria bacterium]|nr:transporter [Pseudomonadota bacterium]
MPALADEGGASAWLPGQFASFAAEPGDPGFALETIYYTRSASASSSRTFPIGASLAAGYSLAENYVFLTPSYTFSDPVLNGQLWLGMTFAVGNANTSVSAVLSGPSGSFAASSSDFMTGVGDLYPLATLKWQLGNHNVMTYATAAVPVGAYDATRLAGLGIGHWAIDGGLGYTFANDAGLEFSITAGVTYNFINSATQYQSGVDGHIDWGASIALGEKLYLGVVGYFYDQLGPDSGPGARLGAFQSKVTAVGPQIGYAIDLGVVHADLNLRGYKEFDAQNRPEGWNLWLTLSLSKFRPPARGRS